MNNACFSHLVQIVRRDIRWLAIAWGIAWASALGYSQEVTELPIQHEMLIVIGAAGEDKYAEGFSAAADAWQKAASLTQARIEIVGVDESETSDLERIRSWIDALEPQSAVPAWIVYVGHGTHTPKRTSINLKGPDLDAETLATWLTPIQRPLIFIHGGSASAPFIQKLSGKDRILITATRSGEEVNYARFGERFAHVIANRAGDSNQDGQVSLLEAFAETARLVADFYEEAGRLASEHPLIDDNGDSVGTPADWFRGERLIKEPKDDQTPDGFRSRQIALIASEQENRLSPKQRLDRDRLELEMEELRARKKSMSEADYYDELQRILLRLAKIYLEDDNDS